MANQQSFVFLFLELKAAFAPHNAKYLPTSQPSVLSIPGNNPLVLIIVEQLIAIRLVWKAATIHRDMIVGVPVCSEPIHYRGLSLSELICHLEVFEGMK